MEQVVPGRACRIAGPPQSWGLFLSARTRGRCYLTWCSHDVRSLQERIFASAITKEVIMTETNRSSGGIRRRTLLGWAPAGILAAGLSLANTPRANAAEYSTYELQMNLACFTHLTWVACDLTYEECRWHLWRPDHAGRLGVPETPAHGRGRDCWARHTRRPRLLDQAVPEPSGSH